MPNKSLWIQICSLIALSIITGFFVQEIFLSLYTSKPEYPKENIPQDVKMSNGDVYCGKWKNFPDNNLFPNGCGVLSNSSGYSSAGIWSNGVKNGLFREVSCDGSTSFVNYSEGHINGFVSEEIDCQHIYGIDISHYQTREWGPMYITNGKGDLIHPVHFVYIKASEGGYNLDPTFNHHLKMAKRLHIPCGAYHVMHVNELAQRQAFNFIALASPWQCTLPPVLDLEAQYFQETLMLPEIRQNILEWLKVIEIHFGCKPIIYVSKNFYNYYIKDTELGIYPIWLADYTSKQDNPEIAIRQTTCKGTLYGWDDEIDINSISTEKYKNLINKKF